MKNDLDCVSTWFERIRDGQVTLPRFQRMEAWKPKQIGAVLENMLRKPSLPIGTLLVLEVGSKEKFISRAISGASKRKGTPSLNLLDGQQRITAIWRSLTNDYDDYTVLVSLKNHKKPLVRFEKRRYKDEKRMPLWPDIPKQCLSRKLIPINVLLPGTNGEKIKDLWINNACEGDSKKFEELSNTISDLRNRIGKYRIPFQRLPSSTNKKTVIDIFVKMNTMSSPLKPFDIVVAQVEEASRKSLHEKISELKEQVPTVQNYGNVENLALAVCALKLKMSPLQSTYLNKKFGKELPDIWNDVVRGIKLGVAFLSDEMIFDAKRLPTEVAINLASALWIDVPTDATEKTGNARRIIRKTIWRACFTDRYEKTANTRTVADYKAIHDLINDPESNIPDLFDDKKTPLPSLQDLVSGKSPSRKDRLGRAVIAASLYRGGYDFFDGAAVNFGNINSRDYHHLYPQARIQNDFPPEKVNSALNIALISRSSNLSIHAKWPSEYIKERAEKNNVSEDQVRKTLESHLIPYDELVSDDFHAFLDARAEKVHLAMKKLTDGSRLD